jgi:zinc protease
MDRRMQMQSLILGLFLILSTAVLAQSGRGRSPGAPPPRPTPKPNTPATTVLGIPEGGKLVKQDVDSLSSRFILKNGLTLVIRERHSSPLATINLAVKAGPATETDENAGMSVLVRRAILKGSEERNAAAIDRDVARLGGRLISTTTRELTTFRLDLPAESYQAGVELLAAMILKPGFSPEDVKKAAAETLLESRRIENHPSAFAIEKLFGAAFQSSPLKRGGAVSETMLASVTREKALAFYQTVYQPKNVVITVVGDVFSLKALGQLQLNFGDFKATAAVEKPAAATGVGQKPGEKSKAAATPAPAPPTPPEAAKPLSTDEPAQDKLRYANVRGDYRQTIVSFGYRTPVIKSDKDGLKEWATLEMLRAVLGLGSGSRLSQGLRDGQTSRDQTSVAYETTSRLFSIPQGDSRAGFLVTQLRIDPTRIDRAEAEYFREIERFRREVVGEGEMQRARAMLEKQYFDCLSRVENEAGALSESQLLRSDFRFFDSDLARIRAVTPQEIQQAAARYLGLSNTTALEFEPVKAQARTFTPEKFVELVATFEPRAAQAIRPEEVKPAILLKTFAQGAERGGGGEGQNIIISAIPLPIKDFSVLRGPRAYVREDKSLPLLSIGVYFQGGRLVEDQTTSGVTELMLRSMIKSTTTRKAELISQELESYGGEIQVVNQPDYYGLTLNVLSRNAENAVKLLLEILESPFFDKAEIAREREILLADQLAATDNAPARAAQLMWSSLYPGHPYGFPRYGLPEVVKATTDEKLDAWYAKTIKRQLPLLILVGDTDGSALISRIFSEGLKRSDLDKSIKANLPSSTTPPEDLIEQRGRGTTTQSIGFRIAALPPERLNDYLALEMFANLAASGRLQEEIRDKQGLTDEAWLGFEQRLASGAFFAEATTLPANETKTKDLLLSALQASAASQTTDEEFEQARNATIGRYSISVEDHPSRVVEYARAIIFGRKPADVEAQPDLIRDLKKADIKRVAEAALKSYSAGRGVVKGN